MLRSASGRGAFRCTLPSAVRTVQPARFPTGSPAASRSQISWKVISPWAWTVTSTLGSARHSAPNIDGCQPPQMTGSSGR